MTARIAACGRPARILFALALAALALAACGTMELGVERTAAPATAAATLPPQPTAAPSAAPQATAAPATAAPSPTATPTARPLVLVDRVKVYLVAIGDEGKAGKAIGCGDSLVAVERQIQPTSEPLKAAYQELLSIHDREYGQSGLYNALYQCDLKVDSVTLASGKATVRLSGKTVLGGECDNPRVGAQLTEIALQFPTVKEVAVLVNGAPLAQWLSLK
jgi:hypothetical protein